MRIAGSPNEDDQQTVKKVAAVYGFMRALRAAVREHEPSAPAFMPLRSLRAGRATRDVTPVRPSGPSSPPSSDPSWFHF